MSTTNNPDRFEEFWNSPVREGSAITNRMLHRYVFSLDADKPLTDAEQELVSREINEHRDVARYAFYLETEGGDLDEWEKEQEKKKK